MPLRVHALEWAGQSVREKLAKLRAEMAAVKADALLASMLDEVRGGGGGGGSGCTTLHTRPQQSFLSRSQKLGQ